MLKKKKHPKVSTKVKGSAQKEKFKLHPRNKHRERYDFKLLINSCPELAPFVKVNKYNDESVDFFNPEAVKMLNTALLKHFYGIDNWDVPQDYLCPPIPGRADYIHNMADLLRNNNYGKIPTGEKIKCLDIGVGASCIYPIIGTREYGWSFLGTDIDPVAIESASNIIELNPLLKDKIELKLQENPKDLFYGIITKENNELIDLVVCNPPFHSSMEEAQKATLRKLSNLKHKKVTTPVLNFGGQNSELWCEGGEKRFVSRLIRESKKFSTSFFWFSTLISKQSNLFNAYETLNRIEAVEVKTIPMGQGNKSSRIVAWTFLFPKEQKNWKDTRWQ